MCTRARRPGTKILQTEDMNVAQPCKLNLLMEVAIQIWVDRQAELLNVERVAMFQPPQPYEWYPDATSISQDGVWMRIVRLAVEVNAFS